MDTESAGDSELSIALPPSLHEWLDERAAALGIEREALLVQLLETHRTAASFDANGTGALFESVEDGDHVLSEVDHRFEMLDERLTEATERTTELDARITNNVEDLRERVLQLRDAVGERAPAEHAHDEFRTPLDRLDTLAEDLEATTEGVEKLEGELGEITETVASIDGRFETVDDKLDRLARTVVARQRIAADDAATEAELAELQRAANRLGIASADCGGCGESVRIGLLSETACPHCDRRVDRLDAPDSLLGWLGSPTLVVEPDRAEATDE
ncbi:MAG: hypothetical protein RI560_01290 [Natronomonas sp.]|nr:hypothetical protein [Natronomonas sp.]